MVEREGRAESMAEKAALEGAKIVMSVRASTVGGRLVGGFLWVWGRWGERG